ncbi:MAG: TerB family tellurite resistance protein, partial [Pelagibacterales bacterium]|nr:TerB family tellurite resistance protein [Pelagibacterales bacterium]
MFNFLKKKTKEPEKIDIFSKTASLLIHAAKIDQNYTNKEKLIIERTLIELGVDKEKIKQIMQNAEENEKNSNQVLNFNKDIKYTDQNFKI